MAYIPLCRLLLIPGMLLLHGVVALGQPRTLPPVATPQRINIRPTLEISRAPGEIVVDGDLTDPGWANAARATDFARFVFFEALTREQTTEVLVTYDDTAIYFGFICADLPENIRATLHDRDRGFEDDGVRVMLDTWGNSDWYYDFGCNALGVQNDNVVSTIAPGVEQDILFHSATRIVPDGYQVEIALPFSSISFPATGLQRWRINFLRMMPRTNVEQNYWSIPDRSDPCTSCRFGYLTGLDVNASIDRPLLLQPTVEAKGSFSPSTNGTVTFGSIGPTVNAAWRFSPSLTASAQIRPDQFGLGNGASGKAGSAYGSNLFRQEGVGVASAVPSYYNYPGDLVLSTTNNPDITLSATERGERYSLAWSGWVDNDAAIPGSTGSRSDPLPSGSAITNSLDGTWSLQEGTWFRASATDIRWSSAGSWTGVTAGGTVRFGENYFVTGDGTWEYRVESNDSLLLPTSIDKTFANGEHTSEFDGESFSGWQGGISVARRSADGEIVASYERITASALNADIEGTGEQSASFSASQTFYPTGESFIGTVTPAFGLSLYKPSDIDVLFLLISGSLAASIREQIDFRINYYTSGYNANLIYHDLELASSCNFSELISGRIGVALGSRKIDSVEWASSLRIGASASIHPLRQLEIVPSFSFGYDKEYKIVQSRSISASIDTRWHFRRDFFLQLEVDWHHHFRNLTPTGDYSYGNLDITTLAVYRVNPFSTLSLGGSISNGTFTVGETTTWYTPVLYSFVTARWLFGL